MSMFSFLKIRRAPDFIIGPPDDPYLYRWYVIPRNRVFNIYLHQFLRSDDDRALHDHPWLFNLSVLLKGEYIEHLPGGSRRHRKTGAVYFRAGKAPHRVELLKYRPYFNFKHELFEAPCWTLFITGPKVREWGFYCPKGWRHWKDFTANTDKNSVTGRGCE